MVSESCRQALATSCVVIIGGDPLGSHLACCFDHAGCTVRLIGRSAASFSILPDRLLAACLEGDPLDPNVLRRAGIEEADVLLAASREDDLNAAAALVTLRVFAVRHVFARIDDPDRAASYGRLGIETMCSTPAVTAAFLQRIESLARE